MRRLECSIATGALFVLSGALDSLLHVLWPSEAALPPARMIAIPFFAAVGLLLVGRWPRLKRAAAAWPAVLVVALAVASAAWSDAPLVTLAWGAGLLGTTLVGLFLAVSFDTDQQLAILAAALGATAVLSLAMIAWPPQPGLGTHGWSWVGSFEDNNLFGRAMAMSALTCLVLALEQRRYRWAAGIACGVSAALLRESDSLSAQLVTVAVLAALVAVDVVRCSPPAWRRTAVAAVVSMTALTAIAVALIGGRAAVWLGRTETLSGRTDLWRTTLQMSWERPWLGHGYATFWPRAQAEPARLSVPGSGIPVRHPHDGYLEVFYELGVVGLLLLTALLAILLWRAALWRVRAGGSHAPLALLLFLCLSNVTESGFLRHKVFWAVYVALAVQLLGGSARGERAQRRTPNRATSAQDRAPAG